ncbi:hypothetical protein [Haloarcula brevis]|uniref:hypothetical protein n=1 Tax=Haloarcula brevis TaxID=3111453 RepID=UPI00300ECF56
MVEATALAISLQTGIFVLFLVAVRRRNVAAAINAAGAFVLALLPAVAEFGLQIVLARSVAFGPVLPVWLGAAGFLHSLGMLGLYESTWWWDHLTHTVSAALVAALLYAGTIVALPVLLGVDGSGPAAPVTVASTFAIGVFWELIELVAREAGERFDIEPVLVHYGWRDTAADLGFDLVGALLILATDLRVFVPLVEQFPVATGAVLLGTGGVVFGGSVLMMVGLGSAMRA